MVICIFFSMNPIEGISISGMRSYPCEQRSSINLVKREDTHSPSFYPQPFLPYLSITSTRLSSVVENHHLFPYREIDNRSPSVPRNSDITDYDRDQCDRPVEGANNYWRDQATT